MSLLRQALKSRASQHNLHEPSGSKKKTYAKSIKSIASVKTFAASLTSFYTTGTAGAKSVPKRRRSPRSELGKPAFSSRSPELHLVDGVELCTEPRVSGVSLVRSIDERLSLVVHHFAEPGERGVIFYGSTAVTGEVRLAVPKPDAIESIEVWVALKSSCTFSEGDPGAMEMRAVLWSAAERRTNEVQPGTYVFPFAFEPFPDSIVVRQEEKKAVTGRPLARVPLPPSYNVRAPHWMGRIEYEMGLVVKRKGLKPNDYIEIPFVYRPRHRFNPMSPPLPFPLLPTRDDWPFEREVVGGWSLTPFGGRGRWNNEASVQVEGLLGIPHPTVAQVGSKIQVTLLLWGSDPAVLDALACPGSVRIRLVRAHVMGLDALSPSSRSHSSRIVFENERWRGLVWADGEREESGSEGDSGIGLDDHPKFELTMDEPEEDDEDEFPGSAGTGQMAKLYASVNVPEGEVLPSFRYKNMAVEYLVQVMVSHPRYSHVSPSGPGIIGEAPVWIVSGDPPTSSGRPKRVVGRTVVPLPRDARRMPLARGGLV